MEIGEKIRDLRVENGLTQEELADRAELSKGFISQVERNLTSPSISTLEDILLCLGTTVSAFFSEREEKRIVFGEDDYFEKRDSELGNRTRWIVPNAQKNQMEPILMTLDPGGSTYRDQPHEGEELGYVLRGRIRLHLGKKTYAVGEGETFYFQAEKQHFITSEAGAVLLWVSTPPSF